RMIVDDRIVMDHWQDHGVRWSIVNGFHAARSAYGYLRATYDRRERLTQAWWGIANWPRRLFREARDATRGHSESRMELAVVALIATAIALGCAVGSLGGPGRSPTRVE
ncbi:MAG: hypothetical protein M3290_12335, partial [Actinomycetota bacterium]|nr:hypothetical protein [Actinomycetota bacterium]